MNVTITFTSVGADITGPFDLYSNTDPYPGGTPFETNVSLASFTAPGYTSTNAPLGTTEVTCVATVGCGQVSVSCSTTTTTTLQPYWYVLYRCDDTLTYYAGPFTVVPHEYSTGERVEGATEVFYTITSTTNTEPPSTITGITSTGQMGCP